MMRASILAVVLWVPLAADAAAQLRSPWEAKHEKLTNVAYACPTVDHLSPELTTDRFYSDSKSSIIDPEKWKAYVARAGPIKTLGQQIVDAVDAYRTTGSRSAAECALQHMQAAKPATSRSRRRLAREQLKLTLSHVLGFYILSRK